MNDMLFAGLRVIHFFFFTMAGKSFRPGKPVGKNSSQESSYYFSYLLFEVSPINGHYYAYVILIMSYIF
uniref:Putative secreted protein n=1 Tax=Anopheles darlingi TaxID=43151 RepID=A0A2M4DM89_ANODA